MKMYFIDNKGQTETDSKDRAVPVRNRTRWMEVKGRLKNQVFSSVAQRWLSVRAAARVQFSVPLQHSEPL